MLPTRNYSATDTAITQRPTSTSLLCIDSEDRFRNFTEAREAVEGVANYDPYNFTINRNESLMNGFFTRVGLTEIVFPWVIPNINPRTSQILVSYSVGGVLQPDVLVALDIGFKTPAQIASEVQIQVRAIGAPLNLFTMTYGTNNNCIFEWDTNDANVLILFKPLTNYTNASAPNYYQYGNTSKQLYDILGLSSNPYISPAPFQNGSGGQTLCQSIRYIDIVCEQLTYNQALKDTMSQPVARDTLARVYIVEPGSGQSTVAPSSSIFCPPGCAPTTIYRNFSQPKQIQWLPNQPIVGSLKFSVYDDNGDLLSLSNAFVNSAVGEKTNWSMTLLITEN